MIGVAKAAPSVVELRIPSKAEWVGIARLAIAGIGSRLALTVEDIEDLKLAVAEACTNSIQHASDSDDVSILCEIYPEKLTVRVVDRGKGFEGKEVAPRPLGEPKPGGLGVFLIRSLMDDVGYEFDPAVGTTLTMTKYFERQ